MHKMK